MLLAIISCCHWFSCMEVTLINTFRTICQKLLGLVDKRNYISNWVVFEISFHTLLKPDSGFDINLVRFIRCPPLSPFSFSTSSRRGIGNVCQSNRVRYIFFFFFVRVWTFQKFAGPWILINQISYCDIFK